MPGSRDASPGTQVSFLGLPVGDLTVDSVVGSRSGLHRGRLEAYSQGDGASFVPVRPFLEGERVTVRASARVGGSTRPLLDVFAIAHPDRISSTPEAVHGGAAGEEQHFVSRPDLRPPTVSVTADSPAVAPGDMFVAPYGGPGQPGPMILEPGGGLVWFKPLPRYTSATNFRVQEDEGRPVLTWWQGRISVHGFGTGVDEVYGSDYEQLAVVRAGNGHMADLHDFQLQPSGTALLTSYFPVMCNLSSAGGAAYSAVTDGLFQIVDVRTGLVEYEWTSLDHVALDETYERISRTTGVEYPWDYFHINSLNVDRDGSVMISARNTWTVYDLDPRSGQIRWRLGGRRSSFTGAETTRTAWQHDPRELADGEISIFDNGSSPTVHSQSRGLVLALDPASGTVSLVEQITHAPALVVESQGNVQALPNGDWFIGWGQEPYFSESSPQGAQLFAARMPVHVQSYRSFRMPWSGLPRHSPALAFTAGGAGGIAGTVYASWNGATGVASWRVLAGASASSLRQILTVPRGGFETAIQLPGGTAGPYLAVQALAPSGAVIGASSAVAETALG